MNESNPLNRKISFSDYMAIYTGERPLPHGTPCDTCGFPINRNSRYYWTPNKDDVKCVLCYESERINWLEVWGEFFAFLFQYENEGYSPATIRTLWMSIPNVPTLDSPQLGVG